MKVSLPFLKPFSLIIAVFALAGCGDHAGHMQARTGPEVTAGDITISAAWLRAAEPPAKTSAAYMTINNNGAAPVRIAGISATVAEVAEVHQSLEEDGVSKMRRVSELEIPAGGSVALEPGGYHVMLINLTEAISPDATVPIMIEFADNTTIEVEAVARTAAGGGHGGH